jgi:CRISPR-associated protein Cmr1
MKGELDTKKLSDAETGVFGSSEVGSKVSVRLEGFSIEIASNLKNGEKLSWSFDSSNGRLTGVDQGIGYLFYSMVRDKQTRSYFRPLCSTFKVIITSVDKNALKQALKSFWLLVNLGGVGSRARRGAGNLRVTKVVCSERNLVDLEFQIKAQTAEGLGQFLMGGLQKIGISGTSTAYSVLKGSQLFILKETFKNWKDALNRLGVLYEDYRSKKRGEMFCGPNFGLPVMHRNKTRVVAEKQLRNNEYDILERRSSPLIFKVWQGDGHVFAGLCSLSGHFLPAGYNLVHQVKPAQEWETKYGSQPDPNAVTDFLKSLKDIMYQLTI